MMEFLRSLDWSYLTNIIIRILPALLCVTLHELAHGYTAYRLGDNTGKAVREGYSQPNKAYRPYRTYINACFRFRLGKAGAGKYV